MIMQKKPMRKKTPKFRENPLSERNLKTNECGFYSRLRYLAFKTSSLNSFDRYLIHRLAPSLFLLDLCTGSEVKAFEDGQSKVKIDLPPENMEFLKVKLELLFVLLL